MKARSGLVLSQSIAVCAGTVIENSILWDGAQVGDGAYLMRSIVSRDRPVQSNAGVFDTVIVPPKVVQVAQTLEK